MSSHRKMMIRADFESKLNALAPQSHGSISAARRSKLKERCLELLTEHGDFLPGENARTMAAITATCDRDLVARLEPHQIRLSSGQLQILRDQDFIALVDMGLRMAANGPGHAIKEIPSMLLRYAANPAPDLREAILTWKRPSGCLTIAWWIDRFEGLHDDHARALACEIIRSGSETPELDPTETTESLLRRASISSKSMGIPLLLIGGLRLDRNCAMSLLERPPGCLKKIFSSNHAYVAFKGAFPNLDDVLTPDGLDRLRRYIAA